ncbi:MAG: TetR/AcrR family transcriptional regulator [Leptolyngbyaceae cyanobacterium RM2_2_4]|nr:TetR/AcrR family transcriptional regulator [Leptolyngbyaceae cyanobacterium RM2_2_4]
MAMLQAAKEMPGRPREFDCEATLAKAVDVFWEYGFSKTTYALLEKATGLHRQSLVYAFGDKKALFQAVLRHYAKTRVQAAIDQLKAPGSPLTNIRLVFDSWLRDVQRKSTTGCLFVNTSGEFGRAEPAFAQVIEQSTQRLIEVFEQAIQAGQSQGEILSYIDAADLARQAIAVGDGALLRSRASNDPSFAEAVFRAFLASIKGQNS